jgi:glycosyltransferase involved in cell wall biosynthesis
MPASFPRISIVTPSFNQGWSLERTLCSVLEQGYPNLEYIVMDGGSTDESVGIIERYAPHLHFWKSAKDNGQTAAVIEGFQLATGYILSYLNSDDILLPGCLHRVAQRLAAIEQGWLIGWSQILDEQDNVLLKRPTFPVGLSELWHYRYILPQESIFFTKPMYDACGGLNSAYSYAMDYHLWLRMMSVATPFYEQSFLGGFRAHSAQKSSSVLKYHKEVEQALADVSNWRNSCELSSEPPQPKLNNYQFKLSILAQYLRYCGPLALYQVWDFKRKYRN